ncbi:MAG: hypothetical protein M1834_002470 [Cirrosporium novae-zelandiae]|nr:MAG: hypothetical protein M1834_002470 [Cirrosporium novae-zelandiae]
MAAPTEKTIQNLNGRWTMNTTLSSPFEPILALQGVSWLLRKALGVATITLHISEYKAPPGQGRSGGDDEGKDVVHIDIDQTASPGNIKGTSELRTINWVPGESESYIFGHVRGRARFLTTKEIGSDEPGEALDENEVEFLKSDWDSEEVMESWVKNLDANGGWTAEQIWGFADVKGERRHVRKVIIKKGKDIQRGTLIYDWVGEQAD